MKDVNVEDCRELSAISEELKAAKLTTVSEVWRAVGKDRLTGLDAVATASGLDVNKLISALVQLAAAEKKRAERSWIRRHWPDVVFGAGTLFVVLMFILGWNTSSFRPEIVVVGNNAILPYQVVDSTNVRLKQVFRAREAFTKVANVTGRVALERLPPGTPILPRQVGSGRIPVELIRKSIVLVFSIDESELRPAIRPGMSVMLAFVPSTDLNASVVYAHAMLLAIQRGDKARILVAVPHSELNAVLKAASTSQIKFVSPSP